eukprot:gene38114-46310_t
MWSSDSLLVACPAEANGFFVSMTAGLHELDRVANGNLQPDPIRSASLTTCKKNRPGSYYGYYRQDANTFAAWELDMVKADSCHRPDNITTVEAYIQLSQALNNTGRSMVITMCEWGNDERDLELGLRYRLYRITSGVGYGCGAAESIIDWMADLQLPKDVKPYARMDPDFLETLFPITMNHSRTEFTFWRAHKPS